jgi:hypothetical protein
MRSLGKLSSIGVGVVLLLVSGLLMQAQQSTRASEKKSAAPARAFYLTQGTFDGSQALTACAAGYHMASLWEIHEPSNLRYDTTLGLTEDDSGSGPPQGHYGWARTGRSASSSGQFPGVGNCNAWSSNASTDFGSAVVLSADWNGIANPSSPISPWQAQPFDCGTNAARVWCVQD